jgi:hypothetical protein
MGRDKFTSRFKEIIDTSSSNPDTIYFEAYIYYVLTNGTISKFPMDHPFAEISTTKFSGNENAVRVTRWVLWIRQQLMFQLRTVFEMLIRQFFWM